MTASKNILIVFPHNFFELKSGVHKRYSEFIQYLKGEGFTIDLLGLKHFESTWKNFNAENSNKQINRLFLYNFRIGFNVQRVRSFFSKLYLMLTMGKSGNNCQLPDYAFPGMISLFTKIIKKNQYDFIIIGYVYWANLLKVNIPPDVIKVLTVEDFISRKLNETSPGLINFENSIKEEIERVNLFDRVICLSYEELTFFSEFAVKPQYYYVPVFMETKPKKFEKKVYDILFIGFDNLSNRNGLKWFFEHVYPLLNKDLKILIAGQIFKSVPHFPNVSCVEYFEDIGEAYARSKITVNPMRDGTGMKVKLIESMSYGIPVVNTSHGLCGLKPDIVHNFIVADDPTVFAQQIKKLISDELFYKTQSELMVSLFEKYFEVPAVLKVLNDVFTLPG